LTLLANTIFAANNSLQRLKKLFFVVAVWNVLYLRCFVEFDIGIKLLYSLHLYLIKHYICAKQLSIKFGVLLVAKLRAVKKYCQTKIGFLTQTFKLKTKIDIYKTIDLFIVTMFLKSFYKK
jgi:hypothetical protein